MIVSWAVYKLRFLCYNSFMKQIEAGTIEYVISQSAMVKPRLLLHACCGPCASSVLEYLTVHFDVTVLFYNPNIMPKDEFMLRLDALKVVISHFEGVKLIVPPQAENEYASLIAGLEDTPEGGQRCTQCFSLRLGYSAKYMAEHRDDFDFFATTLTVSPHKNATIINCIGKQFATEYNVEYLCSNFKKKDGYLRSTKLSKEWNIYRQTYCGCKFD